MRRTSPERPKGRRLRVLYLTNIPAPYRVEFFEALGAMCDLTVLYERRRAADRSPTWVAPGAHGFRSVVLSGVPFRADSALCPGVVGYVLSDEYDAVIVGGYSTPTGMLAISVMKMRGIPYWLNIDGGFPKADLAFVRAMKRFFLAESAGYFSPGSHASEYLMHYGADRDRIVVYPFSSVSVERMAEQVPSGAEKAALRSRLGITEERVVVAVGQFIHRKGFDLLIRSAPHLASNVGVYIIGGEAKPEYLELRSRVAADSVHFVDFCDGPTLRAFYQAADVMAMPTRYDVWGLVVNEALSQGLPVVATDSCGSALEMIRDGVNGYLVSSEDVPALTNALNRVLDSTPSERESLSVAALQVAREFSVESMAKVHFEAIWRAVR